MNKINKEKQIIEKELNDKNILINEYKKELDILDNRHKQEKWKIEKELKENDTRDKNKVLEKINELNKLNNEFIKEKHNRTRIK